MIAGKLLLDLLEIAPKTNDSIFWSYEGGVGIREFIVDDIGEEYQIIRKMLCPRCRGRLEVVMQVLMVDPLSKEERGKIQVSPRCDRLHVECQNCGFTFPVIFHRSLKYKKMSDEMRDKFLDPTTHSKTGGKEDRDI